jgi:DNA polymerase-3 subunit beta
MLAATLNAGELRDAAAFVGRMCPAKHATPVLQGIMLESSGTELKLSAYDWNNAGTATIPAGGVGDGRVLVSGRLLVAVAKTLDPKRDVSISDESGELVVIVGTNRWTLPCLPLEDYPSLPVMGAIAAKIDSLALRRAIQRVLPAADRTGLEPMKGAVNLISAGQTLSIVGTDRWRFSIAEIDWEPVGEPEEINLLVPVEFVEAGIAVLGPRCAAAEFGATSGVVYLATPSERLLGRLVAGEWPNWRAALPPIDTPTQAIFVVSDLLAALARVQAVAADEDRPVRISMDENGFAIDVADNTGSATATATISEYHGEPKSTAVKPKFLKAALATMESDLAVLRTADRVAAPLDFVPLDDNGETVTDFRHVVMPMDPKKLTRRT